MRSTSSFNWRTRAGNVQFPRLYCGNSYPNSHGHTAHQHTNSNANSHKLFIRKSNQRRLREWVGGVHECSGTAYRAAVTGCPARTLTQVREQHSPLTLQTSATSTQPTNSISIPASTSNATLTFWHAYDMEGTYDGGVLEVLQTAGPRGPRNRRGRHLQRRGQRNDKLIPWQPNLGQAGLDWGVHDLLASIGEPELAIGQNNVKIRFREANDNSVAHVGWNVDDVLLTLGGACVTNTATNTPTNTAIVPTSTATNTPTNTAVVPNQHCHEYANEHCCSADPYGYEYAY